MLNTQKITTNSTFFLTALIFQKILAFVYFTILARSLGAEATGQYFFAVSFATMFAVLMDFGLSPVLIREVAAANQEAGEDERWFQQIFSIKLLFTILALGILTLLNLLLFSADAVQPLIYLTMVIVAIDSFTLLFYAHIRGHQNLKYESLGTIIFQLIVLGVGLSLLQVTENLLLIIGVLGLASLFNLIYSGIILHYKFQTKLKIFFSTELIKKIFWLTLPFALAAIFAKVYAYMDSVMLKLFLGDLEVGFYSVAYKITFAFQFIPLALVAALYPAFSHLSKNDPEQLRRVFVRGFTYLGFIALPLSAGIIALAPEIIHTVYTSEFAFSVLPLQLLVSVLVFLFINFSLSSLLNATHNQKINTRNLGLVMVLNIIFNLIFIPRWGIIGASLSSSLSTLILFGLNLFYVWPIVRLKLIDIKPLLYSLTISLLMYFSVMAVKNSMWWPLSIIIGALVYVILMFGLKVVSKDELVYVFKSLLKKNR